MNLGTILSDQKLREELSYRVGKGAVSTRFPIHDRAHAKAIIERIGAGESIQAGFDIEAIVLTVGRPALLIKAGTFSLPESDTWKDRLENARSALERAITAVGRIEVKNHPGFEWLGTGWLVSNNIVVTNRHVAHEFAIGDGAGAFRFRRNYENREMGSRIDLREEYEQPDELEFRVVKVLHIEEPEGPDMAFLEVDFPTGSNPPEPIELAETVDAGVQVAVIGYPAWDGRRNDPAVMRQVFQDIYDVKRLQPGQIVTVQNSHITHDCSTLGGNSGSPVIDLSTGKAVGLHFAGSYLKENSAVPAAIVKDRLNTL